MTRFVTWPKAALAAGVISLFFLAFDARNAPTPGQSLDSFEIAEGFQIELIASEPLVSDPVAMEVDEDGQLYVAEMPGYPLDVSGKGRIKRLTDTDGDGTLDESSLFAENIVLPTGLMRWKNGLLVTAPPEVLYLEDADNDGKAEIREVVLTGFARSNPQHNFNKPEYGLDNWIYMANNGIIWTSTYKEQFGGRGTDVHFPAQPEHPRLGPNANDRNVRFKPATYELESLAGRSQFGHTFDAWGHHFLINNASPQFHEVIAARYLERNPRLTMRMAMHYTPAYGRNTSIYPITTNPEHQLLTDRGMITSAAGITYYLGGIFPEAYQNTTFIGEPVHNLVHVLKVSPKGATFESNRIEERREFLASTDSWFRPVNFYVGPDGALYVVDYYRQIVEHPEWMDDKTARSDKLQNGTEKGRIYRISPEGTPSPSWFNALALSSASPTSLVSHLGSENIWWRRNAQRLLVDRQDLSVVPELEEMLANASSGEARLHALWTLQGLDQLAEKHIAAGLQDPEAGVRENAIILAEMYASAYPSLWTALLAMEDESNPRVRFQLLCTLGFYDSPESRRIVQELVMKDIEDSWVQLAALTTYDNVTVNLLQSLLPALTSLESPGRAAFLHRIASLLAGNRQPGELQQLAALTGNEKQGDAWWKQALLSGTAAGLPNAAQSDAALIDLRNTLLQAFTHSDTASRRDAVLEVLIKLPANPDEISRNVIEAEAQQAWQKEGDVQRRAQSIELVAHLDASAYADAFKDLMVPSEPTEIQIAAIQAYGETKKTDISEVLIGAWPVLTPEVRDATLAVLMNQRSRMGDILDAVEAGVIQPSAIGWNRTVVLMRDTEGALKEKARRLLSEPPGVRDEVVASYYESLSLEGDIENGVATFSRVCGPCHQVGGANGTAFGPDLGTVRHWSARALVAKILKPQSTIADGYGLWSVELQNGETETGLISTESPGSIALRRQGLAPLTIQRTDVVALTSLNTTAMPAGLESQISKKEMADLIAYLRFN